MTHVLNFGCRLNACESETIAGLTAGLRGTVVVNTCAVTAEAERTARAAIRRVVREQPGVSVVVTGCAATLAPATWAALPGVSRVVPNGSKLDPSSWGGLPGPVPVVRARTFLQVQQGCDHRCTFCIIPFGRGPNRSVPIGAIVEQVRTLVATGYNEIVLTGVDVTSYGPDLPGAPTLGQMIRRLLALVPELPRLRLSSIDPAAIDVDLWRLIESESRLMPHLHLSLQAGSDMILKRMKRRHTRAEGLGTIARARAMRPDIGIGADLIAGFPTETDDLFAETLAMVEQAGIPFLHVFPYSERPGTPASRMPSVPKPIRKERAALLRAASARAAIGFYNRLIGQNVTVLSETGTAGHTEHFAPVRLVAEPGRLVRAQVVSADALGITAEAA